MNSQEDLDWAITSVRNATGCSAEQAAQVVHSAEELNDPPPVWERNLRGQR